MKNLLILLVFFNLVSSKTNKVSLLRFWLLAIIKSTDGKVGITVKNLRTGDTLSLHGNDRLVMQAL